MSKLQRWVLAANVAVAGLLAWGLTVVLPYVWLPVLLVCVAGGLAGIGYGVVMAVRFPSWRPDRSGPSAVPAPPAAIPATPSPELTASVRLAIESGKVAG